MKLTRHIIIGSWVLVMTLLTLSVQGQETETKSGTTVRPADRTPALFTQQTKSTPILSDPTAGTYLVVTRPDLLEPLQPLLQWKRQQGFRVEVLCTNTNQRDTIRARLTERFANATVILPAQRYVLLVGDVDRIQAFAGKYTPSGLNNRVTDMYYGEYTGDYLPEAYVGRISVADSAELAAVVAKIIAYEQGTWVATTRQLMFAAGSESRNPAPTTTNGQVNYLAQLASSSLELDTVCFRNPASTNQTDSLLRALSQSNALVNYTAHCTASGWERPYITFNSIDTLNNPVPTLFVNNCCLSNAFDGTCFGERLLRRPTGGAVGVIGATNETLWNEDYYWAVGAKYPPSLMPEYDNTRPGAFDRLLLHDSTVVHYAEGYTLGALLYNGCLSVSMAGSPYDAFYWETYCLLGDPAMSPYLDKGDSLRWTLPDSLMAGCSTLQIACTPFVRISATQDTLLLGTAVSGADGVAQLTLKHALSNDSVTLTATRPNAIPLIATIPIVSPTSACIATIQYELNDSTLHLTIKNVGQETARHHYLHITQDSSDRVAGVTIDTIEPVAVPSLAPQADTSIIIDLGLLAVGNEPMLAAQLVSTDSLGHPYDTLHITIPTSDMRPKITSITVLDSLGNKTKTILPNKQYNLAATLSHPTDSVSFEMQEVHYTERTDGRVVYFPFTMDEDVEHIHVSLTAHKDHWKHHFESWLVPYNTWERFETGNFENLPWQQGSLYPWQIDSVGMYEGRYCARSAAIGDAQKSTLRLDVETLADDSVSFWYKVSSEAHDWLYFFIDGRRVGYWSGNSGWQRYVRLLSAGSHRLEWVYQKDVSQSEREDCAYIDNVRLPLAVWQQPYGTSEHDSNLTGIKPITENWVFKVFPNPASRKIIIELERSPQPRYIELFDAFGRMVDKIFIPPDCISTQYFTTLLRFGVYSMVLHDQTGNHVKKLIVTK